MGRARGVKSSASVVGARMATLSGACLASLRNVPRASRHIHTASARPCALAVPARALGDQLSARVASGASARSIQQRSARSRQQVSSTAASRRFAVMASAAKKVLVPIANGSEAGAAPLAQTEHLSAD